MFGGYEDDVELIKKEMEKENEMIKKVLKEEKQITWDQLQDLLKKLKD